VGAKRYLCAVEPGYADGLSSASTRSLELQGGPLDVRGVRAFERRAGWQDAVALRRWDDAAKVPGLEVPGFTHYRALLEGCLAKSRGSSGSPILSRSRGLAQVP
jgi:gamma-butyrobetaine dioxygenase